MLAVTGQVPGPGRGAPRTITLHNVHYRHFDTEVRGVAPRARRRTIGRSVRRVIRHESGTRAAQAQLLLVILGGLFVAVTMLDVIQIGGYKLTKRRVFKMAPLQHHFELIGWTETTITVRFWIISGVCVGLGLAIFYASWM